METIDRYRRYLKRRNFSPHTIKNYLHRLSLFTTWLTLPVEEVTKSEIGRYIDHLLKKRLSAQTITCHLQTIRLFFDYLITEEQMALCNPITKVSIRLPKPLPRHLKDDQVHKFLQHHHRRERPGDLHAHAALGAARGRSRHILPWTRWS